MFQVFLDVTDVINYNWEILNFNSLDRSFFHLSRTDPTVGFAFDASTIAGKTFPCERSGSEFLSLRLALGSHLSRHIRQALEEQKGYTATVGISTSKLLSKLVGNCNKPNDQTTLIPPYQSDDEAASNVVRFISDHDIGGLPGIGFSLSQKLRGHVLQRAALFEDGLIYGKSKEKITVQDVRESPNMGPQLLDKILGGPGSQHGIGGKVWALLWGIDDSEVAPARNVPRQISIEDSYIRLDTLDQVYHQLNMLARSLIKRMWIDLLDSDDDSDPADDTPKKRWMAHPRVIRLTTRPRKGMNADGTRARSFARISRSGPLPSFVFDTFASVDVLAQRLVEECLMSLFKKLHPEKDGWNLSLVNIGVTNMEEGVGGTTGERDISKMFRGQDELLREWKVEDRDMPPDEGSARQDRTEFVSGSQNDGARNVDMEWDEEDGEGDCCSMCGAHLPAFALAAHERYHAMEE